MALTKIRAVGIEKKKKFSSIKDAEEKRFAAQDAAFALKRFAEVKREVKEIKADDELLAAAKEILKQEIAAAKKAMTT